MLNKVMLIGRLGKDPECVTTRSNSLIAKFSLATDERRKNRDSGAYETSTEWHRVVCFGKQAEIARDYLRKGSLIYLEGKIHYDSYENRDGQKVYTTDINCDRFQMLTRGEEAGSGASDNQRTAPPRTPPPRGTYPEQPARPAPPVTSNLPDLGDDDDLPF